MQYPLGVRGRVIILFNANYFSFQLCFYSFDYIELKYRLNLSKKYIQATRLGKHINELRRKSSDKLLANRAKNLVKKWRTLLEAPGPPPGGGGGGNNNNSLAATNGNTAARLNNAVAHSPALVRSNISPGLTRNNLSPGQRSVVSPGLPLSRAGSIPLSSGGIRSARASPSVSRSATPRVSPATVTISSGGSSPNHSRHGCQIPFSMLYFLIFFFVFIAIPSEWTLI